MSHRGIALAIALLGVFAFCTGAGAQSLNAITSAGLRAYTEAELARGAPSIPVTSRVLYREALELIRNGRADEAVPKLELSASITGDYAAPLFTLARIKLLSASPDFLLYFVEGVRRVVLSWPSQAVLAANAAAVAIFALAVALFATLVALLVRYWAHIDHKIVEAFAPRFTFPRPRWILGMICLGLLFMRLGIALYIVVLFVALWSFLNGRERGAVLSLVVLLAAASFGARYSNALVPGIDPESVTNRLALVNRRGADDATIARIAEIAGNGYRTDRDFALGTLMYRDGRYAEAQEYLLEAVSLSRRFAPAYVNLGNVYFMQGDFDKALAGYQSAVEIDSTSAVANYNIGQAYIRKMLFAQSGEWLERANTHGIDAFRAAHPAIGLRNPPVYESGFEPGELRAIARLEGASRHDIFIDELLRPYLLLPFGWLWMLLVAGVCAALIVAHRLPDDWHVERCENCGSATCSACEKMEAGLKLCSECATLIKDLSSVKVMEALLRTRRQRIGAARQRSLRRRTLIFPGASHVYDGRTAPGIALALLAAGAVAILVSRGARFVSPDAMVFGRPIWSMVLPAGALILAYVLSFRVRAPLEPRNYRIFPTERHAQERALAKDKERSSVESPAEPWNAAGAAGPTGTGERAAATGTPRPRKSAPREEAAFAGIEKGSKWH